MTPYAEYLTQDRRLVILRTLHELPGYSTNSSVVNAMLQQWGHNPSRDMVKGDLRWLEEQGLVTLEAIGDGHVLIATLTERGADVAMGRSRVDGVKRPGA